MHSVVKHLLASERPNLLAVLASAADVVMGNPSCLDFPGTGAMVTASSDFQRGFPAE
jgi:hypothetical protein